MTQLKKVVEPFGEVNVHRNPDGSTRVTATILMEPRREGAQTGIALDGSGSMRKMYGIDSGGGVVSSIFTKPTVLNQISPVAQQLCAYLARNIDADHGTTCIYWACDQDGRSIEVVGDLTAEQAEKHVFKGPAELGTGTQLLPAVRYFVDRFKDAPWGFYVFITDGELFDLEAVKQYSIQLAREVAAGRRNPVKFVLIGLGNDVNEKQLEDLDDLDTGTEIDLWDHKLAREMKQLQEIFAEVVDRNARVAESGRILDPQGRVVRNYADTGVPALLNFVMPAGALYFTLEVNGQRIHQGLADDVALPVNDPIVSSSAPAAPAIMQPGAAAMPLSAPPPVVPVPATTPPAVETPVVAPVNEFDKDPIDIELDDLAKSIDLEFADPSQTQTLDDIDLHKSDDEKK
jgi:hypothetical protein